MEPLQPTLPTLEPPPQPVPTAEPRRWVCEHHPRPVLLGTVDEHGVVALKLRNRHYLIEAARAIRALCPQCHRLHTLTTRDQRAS